ncbi:class I SAM-dependent methyltransferase [Cyanobium sp. Aljojuca 7D2]|uniref:class I SAM-dependent methyltransferase n=1 Tax=Cyanobium sp. Aljojuca 7D2 TaxID=2823698 RepID=UPI0020CB7D9F|nr:class I SAM-dependent methyltransferase [Cyanobium sp. Aljojuca 7D2]MCP9891585.1 class I SAM-dependent methyltransferase [Cyanobium sp. Aljojuca 7D2]
MDFFSQQWATYRAVVSHDLMEHRAVAQATANALEGWLAQRSAAAPPPAMVDLGCGDLAQLAPVLKRLPLGNYTGLDLTAAVLPLAETALGPMPYPCAWQEGNLLAWSQSEGPPVDILHSAFAIHHLSDAEKTTFLQGARQRIAADGLLIWADVFREPGETLEAYQQRYTVRIRQGWAAITPEQQSQVIEHLSSFDIPAERGAIETLAQAAGWQWQWAWQGQHRAEALAVLTPA